jgi:hypothetical protein
LDLNEEILINEFYYFGRVWLRSVDDDGDFRGVDIDYYLFEYFL